MGVESRTTPLFATSFYDGVDVASVQLRRRQRCAAAVARVLLGRSVSAQPAAAADGDAPTLSGHSASSSSIVITDNVVLAPYIKEPATLTPRLSQQFREVIAEEVAGHHLAQQVCPGLVQEKTEEQPPSSSDPYVRLTNKLYDQMPPRKAPLFVSRSPPEVDDEQMQKAQF